VLLLLPFLSLFKLLFRVYARTAFYREPARFTIYYYQLKIKYINTCDIPKLQTFQLEMYAGDTATVTQN
jgi:hypothetical protein